MATHKVEKLTILLGFIFTLTSIAWTYVSSCIPGSDSLMVNGFPITFSIIAISIGSAFAAIAASFLSSGFPLAAIVSLFLGLFIVGTTMYGTNIAGVVTIVPVALCVAFALIMVEFIYKRIDDAVSITWAVSKSYVTMVVAIIVVALTGKLSAGFNELPNLALDLPAAIALTMTGGALLGTGFINWIKYQDFS